MLSPVSLVTEDRVGWLSPSPGDASSRSMSAEASCRLNLPLACRDVSLCQRYLDRADALIRTRAQ